jgi:hypothetical protein
LIPWAPSTDTWDFLIRACMNARMPEKMEKHEENE